MTRHYIPLNEGKDIGELVRENDPETGGVAVHARNRTQLATDQLLHAGLIDQPAWQAAEELRRLYHRARPIPDAKALDPAVHGGGGQYTPDPKAETAYRAVMRALFSHQVVVHRVVIDNAIAPLGVREIQRSLQRLATVMGYV